MQRKKWRKIEKNNTKYSSKSTPAHDATPYVEKHLRTYRRKINFFDQEVFAGANCD
jgi:hypothetical protein